MSQIPVPNSLDSFDDAPPPGGGRRFTIALIVTAALLGGVVYGIYQWMQATSKVEYKGPEQLTYPEHRPYR